MPAADDNRRAGGGATRRALRLAGLLLAIPALACLLFYASGHYVKGVSGRIGMVENLGAPKDSWRIVPAPQVEVLVTWDAQRLDNFAHGVSRCVRAVLVRTNDRGEFKVRGSWLSPTWPPLSSGFAASHAIKPGYYANWEYREVAPELGYTSVLGPVPTNPWTGLPFSDEDAADLMRRGSCPPIERL
jgi:hypothetical protein